MRDGWRHRKPPSGPLPPPASRCFPVHHCSPLFTIVRHCSEKNIALRQFLADSSSWSEPRPDYGFHETRITRHETRLFSNHRLDSLPTIAHHCPLLPGIARGKILSCASVLAPPGRCFASALWSGKGGYGAAWAASVPRTGNTACWVFTSHETRNMGFPCPSGDSKESNPKPGQPVFHESRDTRHETRLFCFSRCFPSRCGAEWAAMARHGRPPSPAPATRPVRFSRITAFMLFTSHESRNMVFPCPSGGFKESNPKPNQPVFHESRDTRHETRLFCFPTHHFPQFPGISRHYSAPPHPPTDQGFARRPPFWASLRTSAVRRRSRRPPGCFPLRRKIDEPKLRKEKV